MWAWPPTCDRLTVDVTTEFVRGQGASGMFPGPPGSKAEPHVLICETSAHEPPAGWWATGRGDRRRRRGRGRRGGGRGRRGMASCSVGGSCCYDLLPAGSVSVVRTLPPGLLWSSHTFSLQIFTPSSACRGGPGPCWVLGIQREAGGPPICYLSALAA